MYDTLERTANYIVLVPGIHDAPNSREPGFQVYAQDRQQALTAAAAHYDLCQIPTGTVAVPTAYRG